MSVFSTRTLILALTVGIFHSLTQAAECNASARKSSMEIDNGDVLVELDVSPRSCGKGCSGQVQYRLHYKDKNGGDHFYSGRQNWRSSDGTEVSIVHKGYEGHCSKNSFAPCRPRAVEVLNVSCYDR